jgi:transcription elongation GreA/GreB family factor
VSRAFVREEDQGAEQLPDRQQSEHPNLVTRRGMQLLKQRVRELEEQLRSARESDDKDRAARVARDLRYFAARRGSAQVIAVEPSPQRVRFGVGVRLLLANGSERALRLVGEDEADPAAGLLSYVSPLAQSLLGREAGEEVLFMGERAEIHSLDA